MSDVEVSLEAMRADAALWSAAADAVQGPRRAIGELTVSGAAMSMWAVDHGFDRAYENARTVLEDLLRQATAAFHGLGDGLRAAADTYEREEAANLHEMTRLTGEIR
ncbi:type VII secretion target [Lentzea sp.]|uniref:type VII secretion target n=1 Tax=Lentzea sp. TaxID=56099 RepID=UPI002ED357AB